jgi:hypothetical protein
MTPGSHIEQATAQTVLFSGRDPALLGSLQSCARAFSHDWVVVERSLWHMA